MHAHTRPPLPPAHTQCNLRLGDSPWLNLNYLNYLEITKYFKVIPWKNARKEQSNMENKSMCALEKELRHVKVQTGDVKIKALN